MSDIEKTAEDATSKSAVALRLEKARLAKALKKEKELADTTVSTKSETSTKPRVSRRKSMEQDGPLSVREDLLDPNFKYRWVLDQDWKLSQKKGYGYDHVIDIDGTFASMDLVITSSKFGSVVGRQSGQGKMIYLMRIPLDEYLLQQEEKLEENNVRTHAKHEGTDIYEKQFDIKSD